MPCGKSATRKGQRITLQKEVGEPIEFCYCRYSRGIRVCEVRDERIVSQTCHVVSPHDAEDYLRVFHETNML